MMTANTVRGEAPLALGRDKFELAMTMDDLARLSTATQCDTVQDLYKRMIGAEVQMTLTALRMLTVSWTDGAGKVEKNRSVAGERAASTWMLSDIGPTQAAFTVLLAAFMRPDDDSAGPSPGEVEAPHSP